MDLWCPWCEWLGSPDQATQGSCPECGTRLVVLPPPAPPRPRERAEPPGIVGASGIDTFGETGAHTAAEAHTVAEGHALGDVSLLAGDTGWEAARTGRPRSRRLAAGVCATILVAAITSLAVGAWPGRRDAPTSRPQRGPALPAILAYLTSGYGKALGGRVFVRSGDGRRSPGSSVSPGPARPNEAGTAPFAVGFGWSPDGARAWVLDARGVLHLVPGRGLITGPVSRPVFSPDGTFLAYCEGTAWPLHMRVVAIDAPDRPVGSAATGCEPLWSDDGTYVAYRMQSASGYRDLDGAAPRFGVRNTRLGLDFAAEGRWPVAWAPGPGYRFTPLTSVSADGGSIEVMDPRGGQRRTLVSEATLRTVARGRLLAPISALAWSPDATLLAVAFSRTPTGAGLPGVAVVAPTSGTGVFVGNAVPVVALSWSRQGNLLAELDAARGPSILLFPGPRLGPSLAGVKSASWSPDGRWILGYTTNSGWVAVDASAPDGRYRLGWDSSQWAVARWCCPPVPVVTVETGAVS